MGVDSGVNQIKLFIQTNQPLLIISVIIVVWFLIYTQISADTFNTQVDAVDSPEVVSESELTVSVEEQNQVATTELTEYSVDYTCGHAMHREAGGCVINTCECVGGDFVEYLGTTDSLNYCPVDGGNSCLAESCQNGLVEDITSGYGSISVDTTQLDHMECKCDPSKGFKDDIPDTSSGVPRCECDPDLGMTSDTINADENCSCDGSKGLTLDGDESSSTYNQCVCNTSIAGIDTSTPYSDFPINQESCLCDSPGYNGAEYSNGRCSLSHVPDSDSGFSFHSETGNLECHESHGLIYDSGDHCECNINLAGINEQVWTPDPDGRCQCNTLGYTGEYNNGCDIVSGVTITGEGPVCDELKGLTFNSNTNQCVCNTLIAGISTPTPYSDFEDNQGSCLCDSLGYAGYYDSDNGCEVNSDWGYGSASVGRVYCDQLDDLGLKLATIDGDIPDYIDTGPADPIAPYNFVAAGSDDYYSLYGEGGSVESGRCACPLGYHYDSGGSDDSGGCEPNVCNYDGFYMDGENGAAVGAPVTRFIGQGGEVSVTPEEITPQAITTGTNGLCLKDGDTQYLLNDSNGDVVDRCPDGYIDQSIISDSTPSIPDNANIGLRCQIIGDINVSQQSLYCGGGINCDGGTLRQYTVVNIGAYNEDNCCTSTGGTLGTCGEYQDFGDNTIECGTGASVQQGTDITTTTTNDIENTCCSCNLTGYTGEYGSDDSCQINTAGGFVDNGSGPVCDGLKGLTLVNNQCICDISIAGINNSTPYSVFDSNQESCECDTLGYTDGYDGSTCPINTAGGFVDDVSGPVCDGLKGLTLVNNQCICDISIAGINNSTPYSVFEDNQESCDCGSPGYTDEYGGSSCPTVPGVVSVTDGTPVCDASIGLTFDTDNNECVCNTDIAGIELESNWSSGTDAYNCECNSTGYTGNYGDAGDAGCSINTAGEFVDNNDGQGPVCREGYTLNDNDNTCAINECICDNGTGVQGTQSDIFYYIDAGREIFNEMNSLINICSNISNESDCTNYTSGSYNRNICVWDTTDEDNSQCRFIQSDKANYLIQNYTRSDPETYTCPVDGTPMCASCDAGYYLHNPNPQEQTPLECRKILDYSSIPNTSGDLIYPYKTQVEITYEQDLYPNWLQTPLLTTDKIDNPIYGTVYDSNINGNRPLKVVNDPVNGDTIQCFFENHVISPESCENTPNLTPITPDMLIGELIERTDYTGQPWSPFLRVKCPDNSIRPINCSPLDGYYYFFTSQDISNADPEWINAARQCYYNGDTTCDGFNEGFANYEGFENVDPDAVYTCGGQNIVCNTLHELVQENTPYMYVDYDSNVYNSIGDDDRTFQMPTDASFGPYQSLVDIPFYETCCDSCLGYECPSDKLLKPNPETLGMGVSTMQGEYLHAEDNCCQDIPESWGQNSCHPSIDDGLYECADLTDSTISDQVDCKSTLDTMMENDTLSLLKPTILPNTPRYDVYSTDELDDFDSMYYDSYGNPLNYDDFTHEIHNGVRYCKIQNKHITVPYTTTPRSTRSFYYILNNVGNSENPEYVPIDIEDVSYNQLRYFVGSLDCELTPDDVPNEQYLLPEEFRYLVNGYVTCQQDENGDYQLPPVFNESCIHQLSEIQDRLSCAPYTVTDSEGNSSDHNLVMLDYDIMFSL